MINSTSIKYKLSRLFCKAIIQTFEKVSRKYNSTTLPEFDKSLKFNFEGIKREFLSYYETNNIPSAGEISKEQLRIEDQNKWKTLVLKVFDYYNEANCLSCPLTHEIISYQKNNIVSALFSVMEPGTHIKPHRGVFNGVLRYHLGIIVPNSEDVFINIDNRKTFWQEGKSFIFDDTLLHEAINNSAERRVVLIIDYIRPLPYVLNIANKMIINIIKKSPLIQNIIENLENVNTKRNSQKSTN
jgi:beta-hydroxylase